MVENKVNWNTVLVVLVIGVVGILLLNNIGIFSGMVTGSLDRNDKQVILTMLGSCSRYKVQSGELTTCNKVCATFGKTCLLGQEGVNELRVCNDFGVKGSLNCVCCSAS